MLDSEPNDAGFGARLREIWVLLFPGIVAVLGFAPVGLIGPLAFSMRGDFEVPASILGLTYSVFYTASAVLSSMGVRFLARFSALNLSRAGLALSSLLCVALAFSWNSEYLIAMSVLGGMINGVATPAVNLVVVQTLPPRRRGLGFGIRVAAVPASASIAVLGAFLVSLELTDWRMVFVAHGVIGVAAAVFSASPRSGLQARTAHDELPSTAKSRPQTRPTRPLALFLLGCLFAATGTLFYSVFLIDSLADAGLSVSAAAIIVGVAGWLGIIARLVAGVVSDRLVDPLKDVKLIVAMLGAAVLGMCGLWLGSGVIVLTLATIATFCLGWAWPGLVYHSVVVLFSRQAELASSLAQTVTYVGTVLGSLIFGFMAEQFSHRIAWVPSIVIVIAAMVTLLASLNMIRARVPGEL